MFGYYRDQLKKNMASHRHYLCLHNTPHNTPYLKKASKIGYAMINDKKLKFQRWVGIEFNSTTKSKGTRNKILGWENILAWDNFKNLIPTFSRPTLSQKSGLNF